MYWVTNAKFGDNFRNPKCRDSALFEKLYHVYEIIITTNTKFKLITFDDFWLLPIFAFISTTLLQVYLNAIFRA